MIIPCCLVFFRENLKSLELYSSVERKFFARVLKTDFYMSRGTFRAKKLDIFYELKSFWTLSGWYCQNCILRFKAKFWDHLSEKKIINVRIFFRILSENFLTGVVNIAFYVYSRTFWGFLLEKLAIDATRIVKRMEKKVCTLRERFSFRNIYDRKY